MILLEVSVSQTFFKRQNNLNKKVSAIGSMHYINQHESHVGLGWFVLVGAGIVLV